MTTAARVVMIIRSYGHGEPIEKSALGKLLRSTSASELKPLIETS